MFVNLLSQILGLFLVQQLPVLIARIVVDKDLPITICQEIGSVPTFGSRRRYSAACIDPSNVY